MPGKVSTEVDARFSFDVKASVDKALHIIDVSFGNSKHMTEDSTLTSLDSFTRRRALARSES